MNITLKLRRQHLPKQINYFLLPFAQLDLQVREAFTIVTSDPLSSTEEYWMSVGLNSCIQDFQRKELNLIILLDVSGRQINAFHHLTNSMNSGFVPDSKTKILVACETIINIIGHLNEKDCLGIAVFHDKVLLMVPFVTQREKYLCPSPQFLKEITLRSGSP